MSKAPALIGAGAMLQALFGAWAVKRGVGQPLLLSEPRDLARFLALGAGFACVISPTVGSLVLYLSDAVDAARVAAN
ncbi:MASE1 domain-containing protein [Paucibacter sp. XJ19-41]|uniref:MASE1 domain-containing protein n=1 Tax=Paucibacter sp. XJ19-41 TaxID=2927824 RepID=UPI00234B1CC1|nr:MASE1 domain-containing protein [Paucibacter sp. XJ19-41]MDC6167161.1 MASE1 domain-containing protein [Paucibacter sp. XJ19-41]